ncbi:MAG: FecR domain-containing protein [Pseudomonadota bacterium]
MSGQEDENIYNEAADIFLRISENPEDVDAKRAKQEFIARGERERQTYEKIVKAWKATGSSKKPRSLYTIFVVISIAVAVYLSLPRIQVYLLADYTASSTPMRVELSSGDLVHLDASSALEDKITNDVRAVYLLSGAAFFNVKTNERPFIVEMNGLTIQVLGTQFEAVKSPNSVSVSVFEGEVKVDTGGNSYELGPGDRFSLTGSSQTQIDQIEVNSIAQWRDDRLFAEDMMFGKIAQVIDRRLPGRIVILDESIAQSRVTGTFDLSDPETALTTLAAARGGRVISVRPVATFIVK